ncbi:MAG: GNAT family N-acetyltransferase [Promicromonosporaceae bacterium]|nr:GNAT family N-acetyltransferase [Promicromonosporaceae bacterium]
MSVQLPAGYRLEPLSPERLTDVMVLDTWAFPTGDDIKDVLVEEVGLPWERCHGVVPPNGKPGEIVGMYASWPFDDATVPGGTAAMGGLTWVGVHPQHRRRGLLSAMIDHHFATCLENGESWTGLYAAEHAIYGRFGYGSAADSYSLQLSRQAALRPVGGEVDHTIRIELANAADHAELALAIDRAGGRGRGGRPGWNTFPDSWNLHSRWLDPSRWRGGKEGRRIVVVERDGQPRAYATFRRGNDWKDYQPNGTVYIQRWGALDAAASHALWTSLLDLDLMAKVEVGGVPTDDAILNLLVNRRAATPKLVDSQWARLLDVPAALSARQYQTEIDVVLELTDARLPANAGRWRLQAEAFGAATCARTAAKADVTLDIRELSAAYLGARSLAALAQAGLVNGGELTEQVRRTAAAFGWPIAPGALDY